MGRGEAGEGLYYLVSGQVSLLSDDQAVVSTVRKGELFGGCECLLGAPLGVTFARADTDCAVTIIPKKLLRDLKKNHLNEYLRIVSDSCKLYHLVNQARELWHSQAYKDEAFG